MQKIREWMEANPDGAKELRRQNRAYIFFREVKLSDKDEAVGAQGVPLTPGRSIAVDKALHVYGTPFFIAGELPIESEQSKTPFHRLMIAQDTGSAIVGPARADLYFGAGADAGQGCRPAEEQYALCDAGAEGPRSCRARAKAAAAGCAAVGADRKAVSADASGDRSRRLPLRPARRRRATEPRTAQAADRKAVPLPAERPKVAASRDISALSPQPPSMKRRRPSLPDLDAAAAAQAQPERGRACAVGERGAPGQAAAQEAARRKPRPQHAGRRARPTPRSAAPRPIAVKSHRRQSRRRRRWRRSAAANAQNCRAARRRSTRGIDLHGMTQIRAHRALFGFLQRAHHEGLTFVLVITGKGKVGGAERGVLRRQVPQWLSLPEFRTLVVGFEEAHIGHGGEGALYVRVRRDRGGLEDRA